MKKNYILTIVTTALIGLIIFKLVSNKQKINEKKSISTKKDIRIPVTVSKAVQEIKGIDMIKTGSLASFKEAKILSTSNGNVKRLLFSLGDNVKQGQTLAIIDSRLLQLDLQKAQSNMAKLRQDLQTYTELYEGNATTREKMNEIRQTYQDAVNQSEQIKKQVTDANIKAPISGIIGTKVIEEGVFITTGSEIGSIFNLSQLKVQVNLTETEVYQVKQGQRIKLRTDVYPGKTFVGIISYISPQADQTHNYLVEITAGNNSTTPLRSGTFVYADFSKETAQKILLIPREALTGSIKNASVYLAKNGKAIFRKIKTNAEYGDAIQVLDGLSAGDQVVTSGQINLKDGTLISISK